MKFTRYGKFNGLDVSSLNLGDLMEGLSDSLLYSGYDDDYYWTRQQMLEENEGKYEGSQLQEMLNQLIERLVEEGYLTLHEEPQTSPQRREIRRENGEGRIEEPLPQNIKFEVTEKGLDFLGYKTLRNLLGSLGKSSLGRHDTLHLATGIEAEAASKAYEFGDKARGPVSSAQSRIQRPARLPV